MAVRSICSGARPGAAGGRRCGAPSSVGVGAAAPGGFSLRSLCRSPTLPFHRSPGDARRALGCFPNAQSSRNGPRHSSITARQPQEINTPSLYCPGRSSARGLPSSPCRRPFPRRERRDPGGGPSRGPGRRPRAVGRAGPGRAGLPAPMSASPRGRALRGVPSGPEGRRAAGAASGADAGPRVRLSPAPEVGGRRGLQQPHLPRQRGLGAGRRPLQQAVVVAVPAVLGVVGRRQDVEEGGGALHRVDLVQVVGVRREQAGRRGGRVVLPGAQQGAQARPRGGRRRRGGAKCRSSARTSSSSCCSRCRFSPKAGPAGLRKVMRACRATRWIREAMLSRGMAAPGPVRSGPAPRARPRQALPSLPPAASSRDRPDAQARPRRRAPRGP